MNMIESCIAPYSITHTALDKHYSAEEVVDKHTAKNFFVKNLLDLPRVPADS